MTDLDTAKAVAHRLSSGMRWFNGEGADAIDALVAEVERLTLEVKRYESRGNQYIELRTQLQEAQAERDLHYNRCAALLFSDALRDTTAGDIRKWVAEYVDAKAEAARYRNALVGLMACTLRADVPADLYDAAEAALKGNV